MNKKIELRILTKSDLVVGDTDVLRELEKVEVELTVNSFDEGLRREIEPRAPSMERRFEALEKLHDAGIGTYAFIAPVIPNLTDLGYVIEQTKDFVEYYIIELLNLKARTFRDWLRENYPASYSIITNELERYINKIHRTIEEHRVVVEDIIVHPQSL